MVLETLPGGHRRSARVNFHSKGAAAWKRRRRSSTSASEAKSFGVEHLALDDGEVDLNLVEPAGMHRSRGQGITLRKAACNRRTQALPRREEPLSMIQKMRRAGLVGWLAWAVEECLHGYVNGACASCNNDGVVDPGEECDEGALNGTRGSCCTTSCTYRAAGQECRASTNPACDPAETCTGSSGVFIDASRGDHLHLDA
jgi:hypothetical protein